MHNNIIINYLVGHTADFRVVYVYVHLPVLTPEPAKADVHRKKCYRQVETYMSVIYGCVMHGVSFRRCEKTPCEKQESLQGYCGWLGQHSTMSTRHLCSLLVSIRGRLINLPANLSYLGICQSGVCLPANLSYLGFRV